MVKKNFYRFVQICSIKKPGKENCRALFKAFEESGLEGGIIITMDEKDKIEKN